MRAARPPTPDDWLKLASAFVGSILAAAVCIALWCWMFTVVF